MNLFNIGAEGQLYFGVLGAVGVALLLDGQPGALIIPAMCVVGAGAGMLWALIPGVLRAFARTNEIITSLMLNYVAALILQYLIFDSHSYWRDTTSPSAAVFPQGQQVPDAAFWPFVTLHGVAGGIAVPLGFGIAVVVAVWLLFLYQRTRFGFELQVIADSPRASHYAGMRTRRKILAVMAISGAIAGLGGASQAGQLRPPARPAQSAAAAVRLHGHRRRRTRALQPDRGRSRRRAARRPEERGLRAAGSRLPLWPRRRHAGDLPVQRPRGRDSPPLPHPGLARPVAPATTEATS